MPNTPATPALTAQPEQVKSAITGLLGILLLLEGTITLSAWYLNSQTIISILPGYPSMKPNTSLFFILVGLALLNHLTQIRYFTRLTGLMLLCLSGLTLLEYLLGVDFYIDNFLIEDTFSQTFPGRPALATAFSFFIGSIILATGRYFWSNHLPQLNILLLAGACLPITGMFAYFYNPHALFAIASFSSMAIHTAFGLTFFYIGLALLYKDAGILHLFLGKAPGSHQFRRLALPIIALPFILGMFIQQVVQFKLIEPAFGLALFSTCYLLVSLTVLAWNAQRENNWFKRMHTESEEKIDAQMKLSLVLDAAQGAIFLFNQDGSVRSVNHGATRIFGWTRDEMLEMNLQDFIPPRLREAHRSHIKHFNETTNTTRYNNDPLRMVGYKKDGTEIPILVTIAKNMIDGEMYYGTVIFEAQQIASQIQQLETENQIDPLTHVYNRRSLENIMQQMNSHHSVKEELAVLVIDVDHFKEINDTYGHDAGDLVVVEFASRIRQTLRDSDSVFRYGGDEFVILASCQSAEQAQELSTRLHNCIDLHPFHYKDQAIHVTCSMGISLYNKDCSDLESCIKQADMALYQAKHAGRNQAVLHSSN